MILAKYLKLLMDSLLFILKELTYNYNNQLENNQLSFDYKH